MSAHEATGPPPLTDAEARAAIRERLEAEWRRPLDDMLAEAQPLDLEDDALRAEADW